MTVGCALCIPAKSVIYILLPPQNTSVVYLSKSIYFTWEATDWGRGADFRDLPTVLHSISSGSTGYYRLLHGPRLLRVNVFA